MLVHMGLRRFKCINASSQDCCYYHLHFLPFVALLLHRQYPKSGWEDYDCLLEVRMLASIPCTKTYLNILPSLHVLLPSLWRTRKEPEAPVKSSGWLTLGNIHSRTSFLSRQSIFSWQSMVTHLTTALTGNFNQSLAFPLRCCPTPNKSKYLN